MSDKKISELPLASAINPTDISVLVSGGTDYKFAFTSLLQLIGSSLNVGANLSFGTTLPQNTTGKNGDVFVNTGTGSFAQKISGTWTITYTLPSTGNLTAGTVLYGVGVPGSGIGSNNDTYINTGTGVFYKKSAGSWAQVFSMQTGPQGVQGTAGANGSNGVNGFSMLHGSSNPSNLSTGTNGDFYINSTNFTFFGPKMAGAWGSGTSLVGAGLETGGTSGQLLAKASNDDYDTAWVDQLEIDDTIASTTNVYSSHKTGDLIFGEASTRSAADVTLQSNIDDKQDALGFTPENAANKNAVNGYAGLDGSAKVSSSLLPSYVDDVLEYANFAALPGTGETGKIYVALDTNAEYRWSGSTYIQLVASPGSTDAVPEGSVNLYFTAARILATVLSGLTSLTGTVASTDSILVGIGKLQTQLNGLSSIFQAKEDQRLSKTNNVEFNQLTLHGLLTGVGINVGSNAILGGQFQKRFYTGDHLLVDDGTSLAISSLQPGEDQRLSTTDSVTFATVNVSGRIEGASENLDGVNLSTFYSSTIPKLLVANNRTAAQGEVDFISTPGTAPFAIGGYKFILIKHDGTEVDLLKLVGSDYAAVFAGRVSPGIIDASTTPATVYLTYDPATRVLVSRTVAEVASDIGAGGGGGGGSSSKISYNFYQSVL